MLTAEKTAIVLKDEIFMVKLPLRRLRFAGRGAIGDPVTLSYGAISRRYSKSWIFRKMAENAAKKPDFVGKDVPCVMGRQHVHRLEKDGRRVPIDPILGKPIV
jgi:hypothetical protein